MQRDPWNPPTEGLLRTKPRQYSPAGLGLALLIALAGSVLLAILYVWLLRVIPLIYASVVIALGYGWLIGEIAAKAVWYGKLRDRRSTLWLAMLGAGAGYYAAWIFWLGSITHESAALFLNPVVLGRSILGVNEVGTWSFGREGILGTQSVNGILLALVWLGEAIAIFGLAALSASRRAPDFAFCEQCSSWCDKGRLLHSYGGVSAVELKLRLEQKDWAFFTTLPAARYGNLQRVDLEHYRCKCGKLQTLAVQRVTIKVQQTGRSESKVIVLNKLPVTPAELEWIERTTPLEPGDNLPDAPAPPASADDQVDLGL